MSGSQELQPWSNDPNAPDITYMTYFEEKSAFAGNLIASILYGFVIVVFFKCMTALFDPVYRRGERVNWGLVSYTVVMFALATAPTAMYLQIQSISYIDNRNFPGVEGFLPPGPIAYQVYISLEAISIIPSVALALSNWLADGLLLYRCYIIYSKNHWVVAFPCLIYLSSIVIGIIFNYQNARVAGITWTAIPYFSISLSLNVLLTLMIVIRLILYARNTHTAMGLNGIGGLCKAIVTMLVESCALYAVSSLLVIGPWSANINPITNFFLAVLPEIQVIAPLLIVQRVANKSALTGDAVASGQISGFKARTRGRSMGGDGSLPGSGDPMSSVDEHEMSSGEIGIGFETTTDSNQDRI